MKYLLLFSFLLFFGVFTKAQIVLDWEVFHPLKKEWFPFGVRGFVQEFLIKTKELPDPFYGENEALFQWVEEEQWHFRAQFFLNENFYNAQELNLDIPNLDTYAQIYLNGKLLATTDNFFVHYQIPIKVADLLCGYNTLEILIEAPVCHHHDAEKIHGFTYPAPNDVGQEKVAPYTRKPQYHFGWDWAPRINTLGFAYPISIDVKAKTTIDYLLVNTLALTDSSAQLQLKFELNSALSKGVFKAQSQYFKTFQFQANEQLNQVVFIDQPKLWWPVGQGAAHLYQDTLLIFNEANELVLAHPFEFGIRQAKVLQQKDEWGTSFTFEINGRPIFAKGANVIPPGIFSGPELDAAFAALVPQMQAANFNIVRIWGGGMYAPESFLNACDRAGIMVWHDFMFACAMYPADAAFMSQVSQEIKQHIPRLASHASVVYFNGNNEVDVAWKNWGFQLQYHLNDAAQKTIENAYQAVFLDLLPEQVQAYTNLPYIHTSPLSNWGNDEYFNHGTMHYWGVWHGKDPLTDFANKIGRFNAEYGFQSFPELATVNQFALPKDLSLTSAVMKNHQKSYVGNGMIEKHAKHYYGKSKDFEAFVYHSQLTQQKAVSMAIAGHRSDAPRCMGTIYWQLNDCWPAPTWSSIDYFGAWKALHYAVQDDYRSIAVLEKHLEDARFLVLCSEVPEDTLVTVEVQFYNENGVFQRKERKTYPVQQYKTQVLMGISETYTGFVKVVIDEHYERLFTYIPKRKAPAVQPILTIENVDPVLKTAVLSIDTKLPLVDFWVYAKQRQLHFDTNFKSLLPGIHKLPFSYSGELPTTQEMQYQVR
jgi:beta-mannosidase